MTIVETYWYAVNNHTKPDFDLNHYQEIVCKDSFFAYSFARDIPGANIEYCQEHACKDYQSALWFADEIPTADIEYCRKACEHDEFWLNEFDKMIAKKAML